MKQFFLAVFTFLGLNTCQTPVNDHWLGYVEGEMALIGAPQPGWITTVNVTRGAEIKVGDALFTLDAVREVASKDNANAQIAGAKEQASQAAAQLAQAVAQQAQNAADIVRTQKELSRQEDLVRMGGSPRRDLETAQAAYDSAQAQRAQIIGLQTQAAAARRQAEALARQGQATLDTADFNLSERAVRALIAGQVQDIYFRQGEYANAGAPVVAVLPPTNVFARFFVPEPQIASLKLGTQVHISCDGCAADLVGTISFIAAQTEFTPPVIYSVGNRERLVFKVEARAANGLPIRPGLPVEVWPITEAAKTPQATRTRTAPAAPAPPSVPAETPAPQARTQAQPQAGAK